MIQFFHLGLLFHQLFVFPATQDWQIYSLSIGDSSSLFEVCDKLFCKDSALWNGSTLCYRNYQRVV